MKSFLSLISCKNMIIIVSTIIAISIYFIVQKNMTSKIADAATVKAWVENGALIVDVRTPEEFASGRYEGAVNIPLADIEKNISLFGNKEQKIIVYCRSGNRSGKAKRILEEKGFLNVINGGGLKDMPR